MVERTWFIGKVDAGDEFKVAKRLRREGLRIMCPAYRVKTRPARKKKPVVRAKAAYPGYLFIDRGAVLDLERVVMGVPGFQYIVSFDNEYSEQDDGHLRAAIAYIRELESQGVFMPAEVNRLATSMLLGAFVKVSGGPAGGRYGTIKELKGGQAQLGGADFPKPTWIDIERLVLQKVEK